MSKFKSSAKKDVAIVSKHANMRVVNFMNGISYKINPLDTLRIIAASSIFGEASYYRDSSMRTQHTNIDGLVIEFDGDKTTDQIFTEAIDNALSFDFKATLDLAVELRNELYMRLNPAIILVRASIHPNRENFTLNNPGAFAECVDKCSPIPNDITNQFEYYMWLKKGKNSLPNILKKSWAKKLAKYSKYHIAKYKSKYLIDIARISHVKGNDSTSLNELLKTGTVEISDDENTWERLKSANKNWMEILTTINMPHMALLRNLRNILEDSSVNIDLLKETMVKLTNGVLTGKQFPFRYYTAYKMIKTVSDSDEDKRMLVLKTLEQCLKVSIQNMPVMSGKTISLSDNSGSATGALTSEYGTVHVSEIANLSSVFTAMNSDEGFVGIFGDRLEMFEVAKTDNVFNVVEKCNRIGKSIGGATENGIWLFFKNALLHKTVYDNIFIYSDQQAGHGGLYGTNTEARLYADFIYGHRGTYIDVLKLVTEYRKKVNPRVNVYTVQVAGYDNVVLPENLYRTSILSGWTGKETVYASNMAKIWDQIEQKNK